MQRACFEDGPWFPGVLHPETSWANGVFLHHAGRKDFFDTLKILYHIPTEYSNRKNEDLYENFPAVQTMGEVV